MKVVGLLTQSSNATVKVNLLRNTGRQIQWNYAGKCCGQSHKRCFYEAYQYIKFVRAPGAHEKDAIDEWIEKAQEQCLFSAEPLHQDSFGVWDNYMDKYCGECHKSCFNKTCEKYKFIKLRKGTNKKDNR